ncbi:hypothetical protein KIPB_014012, partial [Kipferlia bialata]|eukprot:g14012.t1
MPSEQEISELLEIWESDLHADDPTFQLRAINRLGALALAVGPDVTMKQ